MNELLLHILTGFGAVALFVFGMKTLGEGMQKITGQRVRKALGTHSHYGIITMLKGVGSAAAVQSSSVTTVMIVNSVNAGLMNLHHAIWGIMGANIGTTFSAWIILVLGYSLGDYFEFWFPLLLIGVPLLFIKTGLRQIWGEAIVGLSVVFIALFFIRQSAEALFIAEEFASSMPDLSAAGGLPFGLMFLALGTAFTVVVQSSATTSAIALVLVGVGLPFEMGAAIIIGENLGTTITAIIAASLGNVHAKRAARAHLAFNIFGAVLMIILFSLVASVFGGFIEFLAERMEVVRATQYGVCVFHSVFNVLIALILAGFVGLFARLLVKFLPSRKEEDEEFKLELLFTTQQTGDLALLDARKEVVRMGAIVQKMSGLLMDLLSESDQKKQIRLQKKIAQYEDETDQIEINVGEYLSALSQNRLSESGSLEVQKMLSIVMDLEKQGDVFYQMARILERKSESRTYFLPKQRANIYALFNLVDDAIQKMVSDVKLDDENIDIKQAAKLEREISKLRKKLHKDHIKDVEKGKYSIQSGMAYHDMISSLDKISELAYKVTETLVSND
jgi:phosphate:Na+ symporter